MSLFVGPASDTDGCWCYSMLYNRWTHLPLALLGEDLRPSYVHSVPGYSQFQLPLPAVASQWLTGLRSWVDVTLLTDSVYLESKDWLTAVEMKCFKTVSLHNRLTTLLHQGTFYCIMSQLLIIRKLFKLPITISHSARCFFPNQQCKT